MNHSRRYLAFLATALLGVLLMTAFGCQGKQESTRTDQDVQALRMTAATKAEALEEQIKKSTNRAQLVADIHGLDGLLGHGVGVPSTPLKVRGGSVTVRMPPGQNLDCRTYKPTCAYPIDPSAEKMIYLTGVLPTGGTSVTSVPLTPNQGWSLTLTFRQGVGAGEDQGQTLRICTDQECSASGNLTGMIYLKGDPDPHGDNWSQADVSDPIGGTNPSGWAYRVSKCNSVATAGESQCNHIYNIEYRTSGGLEVYHCQDGECSIEIGS